MSSLVLWHNPRCSKSRQALALLEEHNVDFKVVEYLKSPPSKKELQQVLKKLEGTPSDLVRVKESLYKENPVDIKNQEQVSALLFKEPTLIERPVLISESSAIIGRPPENILKLF